MGDKGLAIATWAAILGTLAVNTLSNIFPIDGNTVADLANGPLGGVLITPANYAFIIWGVIYVGLIVYASYQGRHRGQLLIKRINRCLIVACGAQIVWIYLFTLQLYWLSVVAMAVILLALIAAYSELAEGEHQAERQAPRRRQRVDGPISIYLAWISVATVVNVASAFYASGLQELGLSGVTWTAIMVVVANCIAALAIVRRWDLPFALVFIWADLAIAQRHQDMPGIWVTCLVMAAMLVGLLVVRRYPKKSW